MDYRTAGREAIGCAAGGSGDNQAVGDCVREVPARDGDRYVR